MVYKSIFVCGVLLAVVAADLTPVKFQPCGPTGEGETPTCTISNVRVDPCPEALEDEPCRLKRGKTANIAFDFTPAFNDAAPKNRAYWATLITDLPFIGMDTDACKFSTCPYVSGTANHYNYTLNISKSYLAQRYDVKWKIWDSTSTPQDKRECCFIFKMRLV